MRQLYERGRQRFAALMRQYLAKQPPEQSLNLDGAGTNSLAACLLGLRAGKGPLFADLVKRAVDANITDRITLYNDPATLPKRTGDHTAEYGYEFVMTYMRCLGLEDTRAEIMNFMSSTTMCPRLTETAEGNFIPALIAAFREAIVEVLGEYQQ